MASRITQNACSLSVRRSGCRSAAGGRARGAACRCARTPGGARRTRALERVGVLDGGLTARHLADVRDCQRRRDRVFAHEARQRARERGMRFQEDARESPVVKSDAPAVGVRPGLAPAQREARERERRDRWARSTPCPGSSHIDLRLGARRRQPRSRAANPQRRRRQCRRPPRRCTPASPNAYHRALRHAREQERAQVEVDVLVHDLVGERR